MAFNPEDYGEPFDPSEFGDEITEQAPVVSPSSAREPTLSEDIESGYPLISKSLGGVKKLVKAGLPQITPHPIDAYESQVNRADPLLSRAAGVAAGGMELLKPFTAPASALSKMAKAGAYDLGLGGGTSRERLLDYVAGGEPLSESMDVDIPDTSSATINTITGIFNDMANEPVLTYAGAAIGPKVPKTAASISRMTPEQATQLLQSRLRPSPMSQMGQNFREIGRNALRLIGRENKSGVSTIQEALQLVDDAKSKIMEPVWNQVSSTTRKVQGDAVAQNLDRLAKSSYFKNHAPEMIEAIKERAEFYRGKEFDVQEAIADLSDFNEQMRSLDQRVGPPEDVAKSKLQYKIIESVRDGLRDNLNETVSPSSNPNLFKEAYRDFSNLSDIEFLMRKADVAEGNIRKTPLISEVVEGGVPTAKRGLLEKLNPFKVTPSKDVSRAIKAAGDVEFPEPTPMGPQKPSLLPGIRKPRSDMPKVSQIPQAIKVPKRLMEDFQLKQRYPSLRDEPIKPSGRSEIDPETVFKEAPIDWAKIREESIPTWTQEVMKATRSRTDFSQDISTLRSTLETGGKKALKKLSASEDVSPWLKNVSEKLSQEKYEPVIKDSIDRMEKILTEKAAPRTRRRR